MMLYVDMGVECSETEKKVLENVIYRIMQIAIDMNDDMQFGGVEGVEDINKVV